MTTIVTRTSKGAPLTRAELDANFTNLNNDKVETSNVQYTTPGSGAVSVVVNPALNSNLGGFANVIAGGGAIGNPQIINFGNYNTISGGYDNQTAPASGGASSSEANTIAGGAHHRMESGVNHGTIMGGSYGLIKADVTYATIGGGSSHTITGMSGTVSGGAQNTAGRDATVGGGVVNTASGRYAVVGGGTLNTASAEAATIAGGNGNTAAGGSFVGGGYQNNIAAGNYNTVGGGYQNVLGNTASSSYSTIGGGRANSIQTGQYVCIPGGYQNSATADYTVATGWGSRAYLRGMVAHSAASNTSQLSSVHLYRQTTTATEADLLLDGGGVLFVIADNTLASFTLHICAARTDVVGEFAWYLYRGVFKREGTVGSVALLSSTLVDSYETTAAWSTRLAVNTANGAFRIPVTGEAGKTIRWSARMDMIEQRFA